MHTMMMSSPLGPLRLRSNGAALTAVTIRPKREVDAGPEDALLRRARAALERYFAGSLRELELPLAPAGSPFQLEVWRALLEIPFGTTLSYGELAARLGRPGAARAVGRANATNPLAIVVPCHRVIGRDGSLTGYAGGVDVKRWLLSHEASVAQGFGIQISALRSSAAPSPSSIQPET